MKRTLKLAAGVSAPIAVALSVAYVFAAPFTNPH